MVPSPPLPIGADSHTLTRWHTSQSKSRHRSRQTYHDFLAEAAALDAAQSRATMPIAPSLISSIPLEQKRSLRRWKRLWWVLLAVTQPLVASSTVGLTYLARSAAAKNLNPNYITWSAMSLAVLICCWLGIYMLWWHRRERRRMEAEWQKLEVEKWMRNGREKSREAERAEKMVERLREGLRTRSHSQGERGRSVSRGRRKRQETEEGEQFAETNMGVLGTTEQECQDDMGIVDGDKVNSAEEKKLNVQGTLTDSTAVNSDEAPQSTVVLESRPLSNGEGPKTGRVNLGRQSPVHEKHGANDTSKWYSEAEEVEIPRVTSGTPLPKRISSLAYAASHGQTQSGTSSFRPSMPDTLPPQKDLSNNNNRSSGLSIQTILPRRNSGEKDPLSSSPHVQTFPNTPWVDRPSTSESTTDKPIVTSPVSIHSFETMPSGISSLYDRVIGESSRRSHMNQIAESQDQPTTSHRSDMSHEVDTLAATVITREGHGEMGSLQSDDNFLAANELEEDAVSYDSGEAEARRGRSRSRVSPWLEGQEDSYETMENEGKEEGEGSGRGRRTRIRDAWRSISMRSRRGSEEWRKDENRHWCKVKAESSA